MDLPPCRPAQSKALSFVQAKRQLVVQKEAPKSTFHAVTNERLIGNEASQYGGKQATDHKPSEPARPHHRGLSNAIIHPIEKVDHGVVEVDSGSSLGSLQCRRRPDRTACRGTRRGTPCSPSWPHHPVSPKQLLTSIGTFNKASQIGRPSDVQISASWLALQTRMA